MQSSRLMLAARTLVMLTALVALPSFAIFGFSLPDKILEKLPWLRAAGNAIAEVCRAFQSDAVNPPGERSSMPVETLPARENDAVDEAKENDRPTEPASIADPPLVAARFDQAPRGQAEAAAAPRRPAGLLQTVRASAPPIAARPDPPSAPPPDLEKRAEFASADRPEKGSLATISPPASSPAMSDDAPQSDEAIAQASAELQRRLRELGATYYLLETWGDEADQLFRFQCRMAVGAAPGLARHFEAIDADPLRAMGEVLKEVENWRLSAESTALRSPETRVE